MSVCPLISFPGEKSISETQLPSEGCLENTESELGKLDYPGNITMKIWQTNGSPPLSTEIDPPNRLTILPSLVQETVHKMSFHPYFSGKPPPTQACNYLNFIILLHFMYCYNKPISNFKLLLYLLDFAGRLLPW